MSSPIRFRVRHLAAALSLALSGQAVALTPADLPADVAIYGGGGAEQADTVASIYRSLLNDVDEYTELANGQPGAAHRYFFGRLKQAAGSVPAGSKVLIHYRSQGGVFANGIGAVARATRLRYFRIDGATLVPATGRYALNTAAANANDFTPDFGFANNELALYVPPNLPATNPPTVPLSALEIANLNQNPIYSTTSGIAVSQALFDGVDGDGTGPAPFTFVANPARKKTSFTRYEIASILSGAVRNWNQINDDAGNPLPSGPVILIDRNFGSGAKAVANQYFLNNPGGAAFGASIAPANLTGNQGPVGTYNAWTVETLNSAVLVGPRLSQLETQFGRRGIGILGRGSTPAAGERYRFVALDGVSVGATDFAKDNVINGNYDYWYTGTFLSRNKPVAIPGANPAADARFNQAGTPHGDLTAAVLGAALNPAVTTVEQGTILDPVVYNPASPANAAYLPFISKGTRNLNSFRPLRRF